MVGEMPIERSAQLILLLLYLCFTWIGGVDSRYGSTADQGRTGREVSSSRLWRPARALGTHAKQGPSTGHSVVGLRQAGNALLTPRPHFTAHHARLVTRWFVLRTALLFVRSAVRLVYAELPVAGSGLLAEASNSASWVIVSWVATASLSPVESSARRAPTAHCPTEPPPPRSTRPDPKANPGTRTNTHDRVQLRPRR
jgi:hypothetical protein